ncbi:dual specificity protein phosphatase PPS1 [Microthyrium microscopicum]|uniref:Dual specificity protein phosphatase PPS1 n=1 Tax=Microthyrium microscopicum TaxID=703497 RepID=A0A6A6UJG4_9PEZI|nr:dual specificity protein phosphatase PPS1 [Microthyrium microscopicum]
MATIVEQAPTLPSRPTTPPPHLTLNTSLRGTPAPIPNKHIPVCSPGPTPAVSLNTPPTSPPTKIPTSRSQLSLLYPVENFTKILETPVVYSIEPSTVADALEYQATQPLPDPKQVFPWLHGLHADNAIQLAFFVARRRALRRVPQSLRGITLVKAGGELSLARLKGAVAPEEILATDSLTGPIQQSRFIDPDPRDGFSVRNFQIQACKMATVSDIIVYGDETTHTDEVITLAQRFAWAQSNLQEQLHSIGWESGEFNTFAVQEPFRSFEVNHPDIVAIDSNGVVTGKVHDFFTSERLEMAQMTGASEIAPNVFLGPSPDPTFSPVDSAFDVFIEASDLAQIPDHKTLDELAAALDKPERPTVHFEVPGSGSILPPTWSHAEVDGLMNICRWIWDVTHDDTNREPMEHSDQTSAGAEETSIDKDGDTEMTSAPAVQAPDIARKVLIHCPDGYTESSLLGLTYFMYAHGLTVADAWVKLHREYKRNFFAYSTDAALLTSIQARILAESPVWTSRKSSGSKVSVPADPEWLAKHDGSLPSRVLPYMYLGNLAHANNAPLLRELGIGRIVSVGERVSWADRSTTPTKIEGGSHDGFEFVVVENVQDNGVDSLMGEFERCLDFIDQGKEDGIATLVHCRVGVSRSATICIALVMKEMGLTFPQAYCFVRARRLNVIIQPHLRFTYELLKWEEELRVRRGEPPRRELEWATVTREIAAMNRPYCRS